MKQIQVYKYLEYKGFILDRIKQMPNSGRGQYQKISKFLNVHSTLISQILSGPKDFTLEQAHKITGYFGLSEIETDYFVLLVHMEKSGTQELKDYYLKKIQSLQVQFTEVASRVQSKKTLSESDKALYYSDCDYIRVWLASSLDNLNSTQDISVHLGLEFLQTQKILDFLLNTGLCIEESEKLKMGHTKTHIEATSPLVKRHHTNWRLKAIERLANLKAHELIFTAPLSISEDDFDSLKSMILDFIEEASKRVSKTKPETLACLNIDLFTL